MDSSSLSSSQLASRRESTWTYFGSELDASMRGFSVVLGPRPATPAPPQPVTAPEQAANTLASSLRASEEVRPQADLARSGLAKPAQRLPTSASAWLDAQHDKERGGPALEPPRPHESVPSSLIDTFSRHMNLLMPGAVPRGSAPASLAILTGAAPHPEPRILLSDDAASPSLADALLSALPPRAAPGPEPLSAQAANTNGPGQPTLEAGRSSPVDGQASSLLSVARGPRRTPLPPTPPPPPPPPPAVAAQGGSSTVLARTGGESHRPAPLPSLGGPMSASGHSSAATTTTAAAAAAAAAVPLAPASRASGPSSVLSTSSSLAPTLPSPARANALPKRTPPSLPRALEGSREAADTTEWNGAAVNAVAEGDSSMLMSPGGSGPPQPHRSSPQDKQRKTPRSTTRASGQRHDGFSFRPAADDTVVYDEVEHSIAAARQVADHGTAKVTRGGAGSSRSPTTTVTMMLHSPVPSSAPKATAGIAARSSYAAIAEVAVVDHVAAFDASLAKPPPVISPPPGVSRSLAVSPTGSLRVVTIPGRTSASPTGIHNADDDGIDDAAVADVFADLRGASERALASPATRAPSPGLGVAAPRGTPPSPKTPPSADRPRPMLGVHHFIEQERQRRRLEAEQRAQRAKPAVTDSRQAAVGPAVAKPSSTSSVPPPPPPPSHQQPPTSPTSPQQSEQQSAASMTNSGRPSPVDRVADAAGMPLARTRSNGRSRRATTPNLGSPVTGDGASISDDQQDAMSLAAARARKARAIERARRAEQQRADAPSKVIEQASADIVSASTGADHGQEADIDDEDAMDERTASLISERRALLALVPSASRLRDDAVSSTNASSLPQEPTASLPRPVVSASAPELSSDVAEPHEGSHSKAAVANPFLVDTAEPTPQPTVATPIRAPPRRPPAPPTEAAAAPATASTAASQPPVAERASEAAVTPAESAPAMTPRGRVAGVAQPSPRVALSLAQLVKSLPAGVTHATAGLAHLELRAWIAAASEDERFVRALLHEVDLADGAAATEEAGLHTSGFAVTWTEDALRSAMSVASKARSRAAELLDSMRVDGPLVGGGADRSLSAAAQAALQTAGLSTARALWVEACDAVRAGTAERLRTLRAMESELTSVLPTMSREVTVRRQRRDLLRDAVVTVSSVVAALQLAIRGGARSLTDLSASLRADLETLIGIFARFAASDPQLAALDPSATAATEPTDDGGDPSDTGAVRLFVDGTQTGDDDDDGVELVAGSDEPEAIARRQARYRKRFEQILAREQERVAEEFRPRLRTVHDAAIASAAEASVSSVHRLDPSMLDRAQSEARESFDRRQQELDQASDSAARTAAELRATIAALEARLLAVRELAHLRASLRRSHAAAMALSSSRTATADDKARTVARFGAFFLDVVNALPYDARAASRLRRARDRLVQCLARGDPQVAAVWAARVGAPLPPPPPPPPGRAQSPPWAGSALPATSPLHPAHFAAGGPRALPQSVRDWHLRSPRAAGANARLGVAYSPDSDGDDGQSADASQGYLQTLPMDDTDERPPAREVTVADRWRARQQAPKAAGHFSRRGGRSSSVPREVTSSAAEHRGSRQPTDGSTHVSSSRVPAENVGRGKRSRSAGGGRPRGSNAATSPAADEELADSLDGDQLDGDRRTGLAEAGHRHLDDEDDHHDDDRERMQHTDLGDAGRAPPRALEDISRPRPRPRARPGGGAASPPSHETKSPVRAAASSNYGAANGLPNRSSASTGWPWSAAGAPNHRSLAVGSLAAPPPSVAESSSVTSRNQGVDVAPLSTRMDVSMDSATRKVSSSSSALSSERPAAEVPRPVVRTAGSLTTHNLAMDRGAVLPRSLKPIPTPASPLPTAATAAASTSRGAARTTTQSPPSSAIGGQRRGGPVSSPQPGRQAPSAAIQPASALAPSASAAGRAVEMRLPPPPPPPPPPMPHYASMTGSGAADDERGERDSLDGDRSGDELQQWRRLAEGHNDAEDALFQQFLEDLQTQSPGATAAGPGMT